MTEERKPVSLILDDTNYEWRECGKGFFPMLNMPVVVRITRDDIVGPSGFHPEDIKMAMLVPDKDEYNLSWEILEPYVRFGSNQLTKGPNLVTGAYVSHWAVPQDNDLENYTHRFDLKDKYDILAIMVDNEHLPLLYSALLRSMFHLRNAAEGYDHDSDEYQQHMKMITLLGDIESCIDKDIIVMNGEECKWRIKEVLPEFPPTKISEGDTKEDDINHKKDNQ